MMVDQIATRVRACRMVEGRRVLGLALGELERFRWWLAFVLVAVYVGGFLCWLLPDEPGEGEERDEERMRLGMRRGMRRG